LNAARAFPTAADIVEPFKASGLNRYLRQDVKYKTLLNAIVRLLILAWGFGFLCGLVYAAGILLVPFTDGIDKSILAACNPDSYAPGLDQFFRALTDYTNFVIVVPLLSWMIAYGLYRLLPGYKRVFTSLLMTETVVFVALAALGQLWPNKTYSGVNVLLVLMIILAFGTCAYLFHRMNDNAMRRFSRVFWLVMISILLTDFVATNYIKGAVARPRPFNEANKPWNEEVRPIPDEKLAGCNSFPSGHTSGTFALLTPIFWYTQNKKVRAGLMSWCVLQGCSRVYTAAHFPFCCLMGGILGFGVGTLVFFCLCGPRLSETDICAGMESSTH
jgi:membrane-associated phospholipid phosphatase